MLPKKKMGMRQASTITPAVLDGGNAALGDIAGRMYVQSTAGIEQLAELWRETTSRSLIASTLAKGTQLNLELKAMP
jgi:hypothetical protein